MSLPPCALPPSLSPASHAPSALRPAARRHRAGPAAAALLLAALLLAALALPGPARAADAPPPDPLAAARMQALRLVQQAAEALAEGRRIEVAAGELPQALRLAPCAEVQPALPPGYRAWGATRVALRCVQGPVRWQVYLPVTVRVWGPALVARQPLAAGRKLAAEDLQPAEVDLAALPSPALLDPAEAEGRVLMRSLPPGQALRAGDLRQRQWFSAGTPVQVTAVGRGFAIEGRGQALGAGLDGQPVRVRIDNGSIVQGIAVGESRVELKL